jgi:uncharacterized protein YjbJ (UPF0337 family)
MNEQRVNGAIDEVVGSTKSHVGNLTGNTGTQIDGAKQHIKGKVETAVGELKDSVRDSQTNEQEVHASNRQDLYGQFLFG